MLKIPKTLSLPLIITSASILSCLVPIVQGIVLTYDGGLLALVNWLIFRESPVRVDATNWLVNFSLSVLFLLLLYRTTSKVGRISFSVLSFLFLFCFFVFLTGDVYGGMEPYFLYFMIVSLVSGLILCLVAVMKGKSNVTKSLPTTSN